MSEVAEKLDASERGLSENADIARLADFGSSKLRQLVLDLLRGGKPPLLVRMERFTQVVDLHDVFC